MGSLTEILTNLGSSDPAVRMPAEAIVTNAKETDLANFIISVLGEFRDEQKPQFARNMAGTLLKNAVAPSFREVKARRLLEQKWKELPATVRSQVKQEVLATLGSPSRDVRSVAANIIGSLSRIELPAGEWPDLIDILVTAVNSGTEQQQDAALTTIGYVCEEGRDHEEVEEALKPSTSAILNVIVQCMNSASEDVKFSATRALCNAMEYIHEFMQLPKERGVIINTLCSVASTSPTQRTRETAMESLVKVAELYYNTLPDCITQLHTITTNMMLRDEESVKLQALQFWIAICETERDMKREESTEECNFYARDGMSFLVELSLSLLVMQEEGQDEDDWNLSIAGGKLLQSLAEAVGRPIHTPVMNFVYAHITSSDWHQKDAALMAFGCIIGIEDPDAREAIQVTVAQAVNGMLEYVRDPNPVVANTCAWVIAVVCETFPDVYLEQPDKLQLLASVIQQMIQGTDESMARRGCQILHNLALAFEDEENQGSNELSALYRDFVGILLQAIDNGSTAELKGHANEALNSLVDAAAGDVLEVLYELVPEIQKRLHFQIEFMKGNSSSEQVEDMAALMCGALSSLARKLDSQFVNFADSTMQLLIEIIALRQEYVHHEALVAIGSVAYAVRDAMHPYLERVVPYVLSSLQNFDEPDSVDIVVAAIGDLCLGCSSIMQPYGPTILEVLYKNLCDPNVDRDIKCSFLTCMRDVILKVLGSAMFAPYVHQVMELVHQMFHASRGIDIRGDPDGEEYVMSLWESIAGLYSVIIQSYQKENVGTLGPFLSGILEFSLHASSNSGSYPETMVASLVVIGDMASVLRGAEPQLRQAAKTALLIPEVEQAMQQSMRVCDKSEKKQIQWAVEQLRHLERS